MKPKVYGIRNCDTMKKEGIAAPKLKEWAARAGIPDAQKVGFDPAEFEAAL